MIVKFIRHNTPYIKGDITVVEDKIAETLITKKIVEEVILDEKNEEKIDNISEDKPKEKPKGKKGE